MPAQTGKRATARGVLPAPVSPTPRHCAMPGGTALNEVASATPVLIRGPCDSVSRTLVTAAPDHGDPHPCAPAQCG